MTTRASSATGSVGVQPPAARSPGRLDAWLFAPAPPQRLAALRVLVGTYAAIWGLARLPAHAGLADQTAARWAPIGVLAPISEPLPGALVVLLAWALPVTSVLVALGWRHRATGPIWAVVVLAVTTLASSWGQIFHTENLLVLHALVLGLAPAAHAWSLDARRAAGPAPPPGERYGWPIRLMAIVLVLAYVVAGIAKLRATGPSWAGGDVLRNLVAHDNLRKEVLGDVHSPIGTALVRHAWLFPPMAAASLAVELLAPVALLGGRLRTAWIGAAWTFHLGVLALMAILFPYQLVPVAFAPLFAVERVVPWARERWTCRRTGRNREEPS